MQSYRRPDLRVKDVPDDAGTSLPTVPELPKLAYSFDDLRHITGLSRSSIQRAINAGRLIARHCGRRTLVLDADLRAFLESLNPVQ
jgi:hypothetical protein